MLTSSQLRDRVEETLLQPQAQGQKASELSEVAVSNGILEQVEYHNYTVAQRLL